MLGQGRGPHGPFITRPFGCIKYPGKLPLAGFPLESLVTTIGSKTDEAALSALVDFLVERVRTEPGESDDLVLLYSAQATGSRAGVPGFGRLGKEFHAKLESGSPRIPWKALATDICHANDASSAARRQRLRWRRPKIFEIKACSTHAERKSKQVLRMWAVI